RGVATRSCQPRFRIERGGVAVGHREVVEAELAKPLALREQVSASPQSPLVDLQGSRRSSPLRLGTSRNTKSRLRVGIGSGRLQVQELEKFLGVHQYSSFQTELSESSRSRLICSRT